MVVTKHLKGVLFLWPTTRHSMGMSFAISSKVENWLQREKNFKPMPDRLGWFQWLDNINLYIEVLSWDKVLRDATIRNKIFFHKLGI